MRLDIYLVLAVEMLIFFSIYGDKALSWFRNLIWILIPSGWFGLKLISFSLLNIVIEFLFLIGNLDEILSTIEFKIYAFNLFNLFVEFWRGFLVDKSFEFFNIVE